MKKDKGTPESTRFRPGQSGNPRGRPRGAKGMKEIVQSIAREQIAFKEDDGVPCSMMTAELVLRVIQRKALSGDLRAKQLIDSVREKYGQAEDGSGSYGCLVVPESVSLENLMLPIEEVDDNVPPGSDGC